MSVQTFTEYASNSEHSVRKRADGKWEPASPRFQMRADAVVSDYCRSDLGATVSLVALTTFPPLPLPRGLRLFARIALGAGEGGRCLVSSSLLDAPSTIVCILRQWQQS